MTTDSFRSKASIAFSQGHAVVFQLPAVAKNSGRDIARLPYSLRILLENLVRHEDGIAVTKSDIEALLDWNAADKPATEIAFRPARVVLQDFTGVPAVVDLAAMREAFVAMGGNANAINPLRPGDLVIDHSVQVDHYGTASSLTKNVDLEYQRNRERYQFLRWGQQAFDDLRVVPPGTGIVHQVNLEYLASCVMFRQEHGALHAYPDTLVGTDSHTTMINGLGVVGWGVGGIEAEAAMLGQPISMLIPQVVGFELKGKLPEGATATDLVLTVTEMLRKKGVVGKFVEFFGSGMAALPLPDRATIANMAPEYGATMGFFPVDIETLNYLRFTGRDGAHVEDVQTYLQKQGLLWTRDAPVPDYSDVLSLDLAAVVPSIAGPKRPQDRIALSGAQRAWRRTLAGLHGARENSKTIDAFVDGDDTPVTEAFGHFSRTVPVTTDRGSFQITHGSVVIAAITSCTNTSNPTVMLTAGLLARKARQRGLTTKPWVKTSLAPGSQVVTAYLEESNLLSDLEALGFYVVGYGCTTCIGNSGPVDPAIAKAAADNNLAVASVLSGNRNFEGRVSPVTLANYLASPPLVVAYALAGTVDINFERHPLGQDKTGQDVFLRDLWPSASEISNAVATAVKAKMFEERYARVFEGDAEWRGLPVPAGSTFDWQDSSTYIRKPPFFDGLAAKPTAPTDIANARCLAVLGDSVTTDHISPAGSIKADSPAGKYLQEHGVTVKDFNSYGSRRGNHEVMMRGTFANIRLRNLLAPGTEGGVTRHFPSGNVLSIYDASLRYKQENVPLVIIAGKEYGTGSSRDWAAKGTLLLGVRAVIAESYERIHRSNLVGMGILPLQFLDGQNAASLGLTGEETLTISGISGGITAGMQLHIAADKKRFDVLCRVDTPQEVAYINHGGILQYVLRNAAAAARA